MNARTYCQISFASESSPARNLYNLMPSNKSDEENGQRKRIVYTENFICLGETHQN